MTAFRRDFLKMATGGMAGSAAACLLSPAAYAQGSVSGQTFRTVFDVRTFGAKGDGHTIDTPAVNNAIAAAAAAGGGTVLFPAGTYSCYSIHLASLVALYLDQGATILAAPTPMEGATSGCYDLAEPQGAWEPYQDYGHNHWHNSLIWGENLHDFSILGPGRIWGKGLSRGHEHDTDVPEVTKPGVGNKAISLKNCRNVILRDFCILQGGWFGILATGVDNLTIDNLKIDTNRDGMDIDCCKNVRVLNCSVNSPWDDGICPKSSFALGYARATENLTITNCYVTGDYQLGTMLDGTWKHLDASFKFNATGRIKCGTESNGGFKNITISNCVFESCRGLALETVDGANCEDITITGITMRDLRAGPLFLRLGARLRGPAGTTVGTLKRILINNITSYGAVAEYTSILAGISGHPIEDIKLDNLYFHHVGGGTAEMAALQPAEKENGYPEPTMFGKLPASGFFLRHVRNIELSNIEIATEAADSRPAFWLDDVEGADFFRVKTPAKTAVPRFALNNVRDFHVSGSRGIKDQSVDHADRQEF